MKLIGNAEVVLTELERWENEGGSYVEKSSSVKRPSVKSPLATTGYSTAIYATGSDRVTHTQLEATWRLNLNLLRDTFKFIAINEDRGASLG